LEAIPVVGTFVPGSTVILALSALVAAGDLNLIGVLAAAIGGALLGDGSAFWLGHRYPNSVRNIWPLSKYPSVVHDSEHFFKHYGAVSIIFARFVPPIRAFVPITAGAMGMAPTRFYPINVGAIFLWAPVFVLVILGFGALGGLFWLIWRKRTRESSN
jgi:membrane protein DedA with SNARE-associated domain